MKKETIIENGKEVILLESKALNQLSKLIDENFAEVVSRVLNCKGKLIFTGIGKAGIIAQKIASTFSSLGRSSCFMNSAEASHGDLGMINKMDMVFLFSNSGGSQEVISIIPTIKQIGSFMVAFTGNKKSYLYQNVDVPLYYGNLKEACGLGLAPSTSTTAMLALGDALAIAVLKEDENFTERSFAFFHPGGNLGKQLMLVKDMMRKGEDVAVAKRKDLVKTVLMKMTEAKIGSGVITDNKKVKGVFSDGDLRRSLNVNNLLEQPIEKFMTVKPAMIKANSYVMDAIELMASKKIGELPVVDEKNNFIGVVCLKDIT